MISYFKLQGMCANEKNLTPYTDIYIMCMSEVDLDLVAAGEMLLVVHWSLTAVNPHWGAKKRHLLLLNSFRKFSLTFSFHPRKNSHPSNCFPSVRSTPTSSMCHIMIFARSHK